MPALASYSSEENAGLICHEAVEAAVNGTRQQRQPKQRQRLRRLGTAASATAFVVAVVVLKKPITPCLVSPLTPGSSGSLVALVEESSEVRDLLHLDSKHVDQDAVARWLAASQAAADSVENVDTPEGAKLHEAAENAVKATMEKVVNASEARALVDKAKGRATAQWHQHRRDLSDHLAKFLASGFMKPQKPSRQASTASCTFNTLQATTQLAALATSINDAAKTCVNVKDGKTLQSWYGKVCSINIDQVIASVAAIAATLSLAANNCAETIVPNVDALCAGSIAGLIESLMEFSIGADLTASSCKNKLTDSMPEGVTPSNIGQAGTPEVFEHRRLDGNTSAQARRLLFGGGKGATSTFCAVDVSSTAWYLAQAGIAINSAANPKAGAVCPPQNFFKGKPVTGAGFQQSQAFCSVSVTGAIYGFLQAIYYIQLAVVQCPDTWNFPALCGAGITGMLSSFDGVAFAGSSMHLACDVVKNGQPLTEQSKQSLAENTLGNSGNLGRRLSVEDGRADIEKLQQRFASPDDAWASIGFDTASPDSPLRHVQIRHPSAEAILELVQDDEHEVADWRRPDGGLLGFKHLCS